MPGMSTLSLRLSELTAQHRQALEWFRKRQGELIGWPEPLDGLFLVNRPKGIHKPKGWVHALSVRQALGGPYADRPPEGSLDGAWSYDYFQEGQEPASRDSHPTNRALMACWQDDVPVAVLIQEKPKPGVKYRVWGLAKVANWEAGHFTLLGYDRNGELPRLAPANDPGVAYPLSDGAYASVAEPYTPLDIGDARKRIDAQIVERQGGAKFRSAALEAFRSRCAISGCAVKAVLEAAHIVPYLGVHTNAGDNALLLRSDLHTLFDRQLLWVDPDTLIVTVDGVLANSEYATFSGLPLNLPSGIDVRMLGLRLRERADALK